MLIKFVTGLAMCHLVIVEIKGQFCHDVIFLLKSNQYVEQDTKGDVTHVQKRQIQKHCALKTLIHDTIYKTQKI